MENVTHQAAQFHAWAGGLEPSGCRVSQNPELRSETACGLDIRSSLTGAHLGVLPVVARYKGGEAFNPGRLGWWRFMHIVRVVLGVIVGMIVICSAFIIATGIYLNIRANDFREPTEGSCERLSRNCSALE